MEKWWLCIVGVGASFFDGTGVRRHGCFRQRYRKVHPRSPAFFLISTTGLLDCKTLVLVLVDFSTLWVYVTEEASYLRTIKTWVAASRATQES
jgi:hypothetical protein